VQRRVLEGADGGVEVPHVAPCTGLDDRHLRLQVRRQVRHRGALGQLQRLVGLAERAVALGVRRDGILIDPAHDFAKNTRHSLEVSRRLDELVATGWPVLVALSNKKFIGETLDAPTGARLNGTIAATAVAAWQGARVFRAHNVRETREALDVVASILGWRQPAVSRRALA
jgi:dihydropteroate synthase